MRFSPVPNAPVMLTKVSFVASDEVLRKSSQNLQQWGWGTETYRESYQFLFKPASQARFIPDA